MKPRNWRTYFGYRPSRSLSWHANDRNRDIERQYIDWLAAERGWSTQEARAHCEAMDKRTLIRAEHSAGEPQFLAPVKAASDPVALICAKIRKLDWRALERVQETIDQRLAA